MQESSTSPGIMVPTTVRSAILVLSSSSLHLLSSSSSRIFFLSFRRPDRLLSFSSSRRRSYWNLKFQVAYAGRRRLVQRRAYTAAPAAVPSPCGSSPPRKAAAFQ
ncbi:hypothetical protein L226DRAFT_133003 [Lentinus tigrinus ALCF2SS1-7]|uniref:uncharacterized protein n=1 Tax=Lentinus tigrinus ALCF2SS1-7 TaxID=1328758 RepID=UPI001165CF0E|nr:hypothetical protein L226DRAFT_133003 [Lentinus tigrinus ALCF2SS1-7]